MFAFFEGLVDPFPKGSVTQPPNTLLEFIRYYTRGSKAMLLVMACATGLIAIFEAAMYGLMGVLVDWLSDKNPQTFMEEEGSTLMWLGIIFLMLIPVVVIHTMSIHQSLLGNYPMAIRWRIHRYLLGHSLEFYQGEFAGRIATKLMQTALSLRESVMKLLDVLLYVTIYFVSVTVVMAAADIRLMAPLVIWILGYIGVLYYFLPRLKVASQRQADARSSMVGRVVDSYTNINTVKLFSHTQRESGYAEEGMRQFLDAVHPQMRLITRLNLSVWALNIFLIASFFVLSLVLWIHSSVTVGAIAVAMGLSLRLNGMSHWIMWEVGSLFENIGITADGMATFAKPHDILDRPEAKPLQVDEGGIEFKDLCFSYNKDVEVFKGLTLSIQAGEKVGIVGRSGAGKSTLVNLLLRFYNLDEGQILIDKQCVSQVTQDSLRSNIGMVTQDTSLLHRTIRENIVFGRPDATEEELVRAAQRAEAHEFIQTLNDGLGGCGYDAQVGERGVKLSGGQRQRIAIARVMLKNAPILILDEATSALDSEVEADIQYSLNRLMQGKTVIAIAHRLSTIAAMDRLVVLDKGQILEQGTHRELLQNEGLYAQLWRHQSGGFLGQE